MPQVPGQFADSDAVATAAARRAADSARAAAAAATAAVAASAHAETSPASMACRRIAYRPPGVPLTATSC
jgi:hypothetical protein